MKNKEEIKEWLLRNAVDEDGDLDLSGLDFSEFGGYVNISGMKVKGDLYQRDQEVKGDLIQNYQKVQGNLHQAAQEVKGNLHQGNQKVKGDLYQRYQEVKGDLRQDKIINGKTKAQAIKELEKIYEK